MRQLSVFFLWRVLLCLMAGLLWSCAWALDDDLPGERRSFDALWRDTEASHPQLAAALAGRGMAAGDALQAALRPNPALEVASENLGTGQREETVSVSQTVELGGKRAARMALAARGSTLAEAQMAARRAEVYAALKQAFVEVLAAQARHALADAARELAQRSAAAIDEQIEAGRYARVTSTRARVEVANATLAVARAKSELVRARTRLAAASGAPMRSIVADGELDAVPALPPLATLEAQLESAPALLLARHETARRQAEVDVESSRRIGNLTLNAGVRHLSGSNETAGVLSVAIPLPLTDRNQGSVMKAQSAVAQAASEEQTSQLALMAELQDLYFRYEAALATVAAVRDDIVPAAATALADTERGFSLGKFALADILETRRTLLQARLQLIDALTEAHLAVAALDRVLGHSDSGAQR